MQAKWLAGKNCPLSTYPASMRSALIPVTSAFFAFTLFSREEK